MSDASLDDLPEEVLSVAEIALRVQRLVEDEEDFRNVWVKGEISGISRYDRHMYFTLKEEVDGREHQLSGVAFDYAKREIPDELEDGDLVMARGDVGIYTGRSEYQIKAREIKPAGMGELYEAYLKLKAKLEEEGLFASERKRPLPPLPRTVGIVTSSRGAVLRDVVDVARRRYPNVNLLLASTAVQGPDAAEQIAAAIERQNACGRADVLVVGRGGGSLEDLWAFNEEVTCRAIAGSEIPVVSAVGHETDTTIADLVADVRAPTPSAAAEIAVPRKDELVQAVADRQAVLARDLERLLDRGRESLEAVLRRSAFRYPERLVEDRKQRLDEAVRSLSQGLRGLWTSDREALVAAEARLGALRPERLVRDRRRDLEEAVRALGQGMGDRLGAHREAFARSEAALSSLSPLGVLERGYAVVRRPDGTPVTRVEDAAVGDVLDVTFSDGTARTEVEEIP